MNKEMGHYNWVTGSSAGSSIVSPSWMCHTRRPVKSDATTRRRVFTPI